MFIIKCIMYLSMYFNYSAAELLLYDWEEYNQLHIEHITETRNNTEYLI